MRYVKRKHLTRNFTLVLWAVLILLGVWAYQKAIPKVTALEQGSCRLGCLGAFRDQGFSVVQECYRNVCHYELENGQ